ncbi:hypothetical protein NHF46_15900 [Arthrobacter alpinus]|nr:hypothetical protein [Arthrobacter alpinus]
MSNTAKKFSFVAGIDTQAKAHTFEIIKTITGEEIANKTFPSPFQESYALFHGHNDILKEPCRTSCRRWKVLAPMARNSGSRPPMPGFRSGIPFPQRRLGRLRGKSESIDAAHTSRDMMGIP